MPIPFLLIGLGAGTGVLGVGKSIKAGIDQKKANEINEEAQGILEAAKERAENSRKYSGDAVTNLGNKKIQVLNRSVKPFIAAIEKLYENSKLKELQGLDELKMDKQSIEELKELSVIAASIAGGAASGTVLGAVTAFGAYSAARMFGVCSTGTAIAALSGAAAKNATLAFLGGGALSAGGTGLGMAGGMAVLGSIAVGPALAIMGFVAGAKASANKDAAYSNLAKAKEAEEELETVRALCNGIRMRANMFERLLIRLDAVFMPLVQRLEDIITVSGKDISKYTVEEKSVVAACMTTAKAISTILRIPLLTEDGKLTEESEKISPDVYKALNASNG